MRRSIRSTTKRSCARSTRSRPRSRTTSSRSSSTSPRRCSLGWSATSRSSYGTTKEEMQETFSGILIDLANHVPADIDLHVPLLLRRLQPQARGRADRHGRHGRVRQPAVGAEIKRPIQLIHMPVPRDRADDAYFEPLKRLKLQPETELCLGLVHYTDGVAGTQRRLATAKKYAKRFLDRDRMRIRPARSGDAAGAAAHPRRGGEGRLTRAIAPASW